VNVKAAKRRIEQLEKEEQNNPSYKPSNRDKERMKDAKRKLDRAEETQKQWQQKLNDLVKKGKEKLKSDQGHSKAAETIEGFLKDVRNIRKRFK
jgi:predicted transcriptional regulator